MSNKAPGKSYRKGISLVKLFRKFPSDAVAEEWFVKRRWGKEPVCPYCGTRNVQTGTGHKTMPYRCREKGCSKWFSVRSRTVMQSSDIRYQAWAVAIYLFATSLKGVSGMKLHRDLDITQRSAWHLSHRIREAWNREELKVFTGSVEADETFIGGKERNKHSDKRSHTRGPGGKSIVAGMKNRETNRVIAQPVSERSKEEIQGFIVKNIGRGVKIYTDDHKSYTGLPYEHESVNHSVREYVKEQAHVNGVESFWAMLKRGYTGTYHRMSKKHLNRYVNEFAGRHNIRRLDTEDQMGTIARAMYGKTLPYKELIR